MVGLRGLTFLVPLFILLAFGAGGPVDSMRLLAPHTAFALPAVAVIAFWWEDWPGSTLRAGWSGLTDTLIIAAAGIGFTCLGQGIVAGFDGDALFTAEPDPGHVPIFPHTLPLAGCVFTVLLQITLVSEGWPLRRLGRLLSGLVALAVSWGVGIAAYLLLVHLPEAVDGLRDPGGPILSLEFSAWLTAVGAWQMIYMVALRGWPFSKLRRRPVRLLVANAVVVGCGWATYLVVRDVVHTPPREVTAACGCVIAAILLAAMLFEAWPWTRLTPLPGRFGVLGTSLAVAALLFWALSSYANTVDWGQVPMPDWIAYSALNVISLGIILHVAIWKRWPVLADTGPQSPSDTSRPGSPS
ncbi:hypothetical protein B046DRAFT_04592 [Streptomyces sp. LamerLS-316]|uniref:hypothetical protein n=1 Tax=unclassified Streptomyces TaxID=2593676 RepID=UPI000823C994|nr:MULTISPECIES: hypothetical protein [unclassified Streptomyces]SCK45570.1 hypothetical protein B046DRAFT_04592 [Streptomyces sp. LamerLS-316]